MAGWRVRVPQTAMFESKAVIALIEQVKVNKNLAIYHCIVFWAYQLRFHDEALVFYK